MLCSRLTIDQLTRSIIDHSLRQPTQLVPLPPSPFQSSKARSNSRNQDAPSRRRKEGGSSPSRPRPEGTRTHHAPSEEARATLLYSTLDTGEPALRESVESRDGTARAVLSCARRHRPLRAGGDARERAWCEYVHEHSCRLIDVDAAATARGRLHRHLLSCDQQLLRGNHAAVRAGEGDAPRVAQAAQAF
eukprot:scaffold167741_cov34-Tisochrysis_lutea.AAC.4